MHLKLIVSILDCLQLQSMNIHRRCIHMGNSVNNIQVTKKYKKLMIEYNLIQFDFKFTDSHDYM